MIVEEFAFSDLLKKAEQAGGGFSALPAGEYEASVETAEVKKTGTGKSKIAVRFKVAGGPYNGRSVFNDFVLSPGNDNAMVIFFRQMSQIGLRSDYFSQNPSLEQVAKDLHGRRCRLRLGVRTWQEVERNSVLGIMPAAGPQASASPFGAPPIPSPTVAPPPPLPSMRPAPEVPAMPFIPDEPAVYSPAVPVEEAITVIEVEEPEAEPAPVSAPPPALPF